MNTAMITFSEKSPIKGTGIFHGFYTCESEIYAAIEIADAVGPHRVESELYKEGSISKPAWQNRKYNRGAVVICPAEEIVFMYSEDGRRVQWHQN